MGFMSRFKDFIEPSDDDDLEETEQPVAAANTAAVTKAAPAAGRAAPSTYERSTKPGVAPLDDKTKMVLFEPRSFGEAELVGARLKEGRAVVVNLHKLGSDYARRTIDFLSGVVFALNGNVQKIGTNVILCYPAEIGVAGTINLGKPDGEETEDEQE